MSHLVEDNLALANFVANRYRRAAESCGEDFEDIEAAARLGLVKASIDFNSSLGFTFSTYAVPKIQGSIAMHFRHRGGVVWIPRRLREIASMIKRRGLANEDPDVIADNLNCPLAHVLDALETIQITTTSLHRFNPLDEEQTMEDELLGYTDFTVVEVRDFLNQLNEQERSVIYLRMFGQSQYEISDNVGVSQTQVWRLLKRVEAKYLEYEKEEKAVV